MPVADYVLPYRSFFFSGGLENYTASLSLGGTASVYYPEFNPLSYTHPSHLITDFFPMITKGDYDTGFVRHYGVFFKVKYRNPGLFFDPSETVLDIRYLTSSNISISYALDSSGLQKTTSEYQYITMSSISSREDTPSISGSWLTAGSTSGQKLTVSGKITNNEGFGFWIRFSLSPGVIPPETNSFRIVVSGSARAYD